MKRCLTLTAITLLSGCAMTASLPAHLEAKGASSSALAYAHKHYNDAGKFGYLGDNNELITYRPLRQTSMNHKGGLLWHVMREACQPQTGPKPIETGNGRGPTLIENYYPFQVCEVNGWPAFVFYESRAADDPGGQTRRLVAERNPSTPPEDYFCFLVSKGYEPRLDWQHLIENECETGTR